MADNFLQMLLNRILQSFYIQIQINIQSSNPSFLIMIFLIYIQQLYLFKLNLFRKPLNMDLGIIEKLAKCIVRPPKASYDIEDLVPACFQMKSRLYQRHDFSTHNSRGLNLHGTYVKDRYQTSPRDTIVFLHANGSSRLIMKNYLDVFLPQYDMVSFDFAACGISEGQYITLGYNEREDVLSIIKYLRKEYNIKNFILWGRSMGAATAILYTAKYGGIKAIVSDNSYSDLELLINELSDDYLPFLPSFLLESIIDSIQQYIETNLWKKESTNFNLRKLKPISVIDKIECPIFFIGSLEDTFVNVNHTKALFNKIKALKHLQLVKGNHNDMRTKELKQKVFNFLGEQANTASSKSNPFNRQRTNIFLNSSFQHHKTQAEMPQKQANQHEVDLVNCAELQFQHPKAKIKTSRIESSPKQELSSSFIPKASQISSPQTRESLMNRQGNLPKRIERSRSKVKRKKIFEGIDYINQHLNGSHI